MQTIFDKYIQAISSKFTRKESSEMAYRADFENLLKEIFGSIKNVRILHDPRSIDGNKPDFIVMSGEVPILYVEAKDIGTSLDKVEKSEQMSRYYGYANLVLSDYVEFRFYRNGIRYQEPLRIAECNLNDRSTKPCESNYECVARTLVEFAQSYKEPIKSGEHLAKIMGGKAQRIRDNIKSFLFSELDKSKELERLYDVFKKLLVHDLTKDAFADMYAQTLVYGLFVARYYDETPQTFTRQEARDLIPNSNPFLRHFFDHIAGPDFDKKLRFIVDELCLVFSHANVPELMKVYFKEDLWGKTHKGPDPVIHFYEDFLKEYDPILRKKMGAYYTPLPVVQFIVRAVDYLLEKEFNLPNGLADTTKTEKDIHKVQILDPAVGTGTFISAVIGKIYERILKNKQQGTWPSYVHHNLLPRLHGFELMMAPYTIAHLKLSLAFLKTGFKYFNQRLGIYLTNSLEQAPVQQDFFSIGLAESIASEAKEASKIKNEKPIMVVIGNPPYSAISSNKQAGNLVDKYKVEPGGEIRLKERKNWLDDDYVKFISFAENLVNKNGEGILAYITNNGFIDNPTFRGMRWRLLESFDDIYILDLHGNAKKKEKSPDGGKDENVFNIMQGVSINIFVKKNNTKKEAFANVYHGDLYGKREDKFNFLDKNNLKSIEWEKIKLSLPNLFFVNKGSIQDEEKYNEGFSIGKLFVKNSCGVVTMGDNFIVDIDKNALSERLDNFVEEDISAVNLKSKYNLGKNYANWVVKNKLKIKVDDDKIINYSYRPFDVRFTIYDENLIWRKRDSVMKDVCINDSSLVFEKIASNKFQPVGIFISKNIIDCHLTGGQSYIGNLYVINESNEKTSNLNFEIVKEIEKNIGKTSPEDIVDYVYAVLHSPKYREKYKEFLKIDFPRIPYPIDKKEFSRLLKLGTELRGLHLMEDNRLNKFITSYPESGNNEVEKIEYRGGKVYINQTQYFGGVPEAAWNFYIGGYQPAQKWLKDRKGRKLTNDEIEHYQKIIVALVETEKVMKEIDR